MGTLYEKRPHTVVATVWNTGGPAITDLRGTPLAVADGDYVVRDTVTGEVSVMDANTFEQSYDESGSVDWEAFEGAPDPNGPDTPSQPAPRPTAPAPAPAPTPQDAAQLGGVGDSNPANPTAAGLSQPNPIDPNAKP